MKYYFILFFLVQQLALAQSGLFEKTPSFLKVTDAYQANLSLQNSIIHADWLMADGYYLYKQQFAVRVNDIATNFTLNRNGRWIFDEYFQTDKEVFYHDIKLSFPLDASINITQPAIIELDFQGCSELGLCYPPETYYFELADGLILPMSSEQASSKKQTIISVNATTIDNVELTFLLALIFAVIGGLILNLMPCVFPVLSIKAMSLISHGNIRTHGWIYSAGVVLCFIVVASLLILLRYSGNSVGWGFQLQSPYFLSALLILFFIMGLSLFGLIEVGTSMMGLGQQLTEQQSYRGTFFTGLLAVAVATPCTAPFMAPALGYAIAQPPLQGLLIFAALGLGMALPMLLLTQFPSLIQRLPRSGQWMVNLKQFMAFPMLLTCVWLLWVLANQLGNTSAMFMLAALVMLGLAIWLKSIVAHRIYLAIAILIALFFGYSSLSMPSSPPSTAPPFTLEQLDSQTGGNQPVFVDVTASWCITCLSNERIALSNAEVQKAFNTANVNIIVADWTNPNREIHALLQRYQRVGIPLYLWFPKGSKEAQILPQILTPQMLINLVN